MEEYLYEREIGTRHFLDLAALKFDEPRIKDVPISTGDRVWSLDTGSSLPSKLSIPTDARYSFCYDKRHPEYRRFAGVDYAFHAWPSVGLSFRNITRSLINDSYSSSRLPHKKTVGWYGNIYSADSSVPEFVTRPLLRTIAESRPDVFDVVHVDSANVRSQGTHLIDVVARHEILLDIGGNGYSGRLKYLLFSGRPLLLIDRHYVEFWHEDLKPWTHFVPVAMDLHDLIEKALWVKENIQEAKSIGLRAQAWAIKNFDDASLIDRAAIAALNVLARKEDEL